MVIPLIITAITYPFIPDIVPTSFGIDYVAIDFANKSIVWVEVLIYFGLNLFILLSLILKSKYNIKKYSVIKIQSQWRVLMVVAIVLDVMSMLLFYSTVFYDEGRHFNFIRWGYVCVALMLIYATFEMFRVKKLEEQLLK